MKSPRLRVVLICLSPFAILALALVVRLWRLPEQLFLHVDDPWHIEIVLRFARDNVLDYTQARPMYPYLVGLMARLVDASAFFPAQVSVACGTLLALVVVLWAHDRAGILAGLGAGVLVATSQLEIYFSKASSPIAPAMLVVTLSYVLVAGAVSRSEMFRWPSMGALALMGGAGLLAGLSVTIHRAFLPIPLFLLGFLALYSARLPFRRCVTLLPVFVLAALVPVLVAQIVTERYQPPSINHFGYLNQLKGSFEQQGEWRSGPGGRGWLFYFAGFWETEGPFATVLAVHGVALGVWRWTRHGDWWCGLLVGMVVATYGYASLVSASGGITVLRAVAPALPLVSILSALAVVQWCEFGRSRLPISEDLKGWVAQGSLLGVLALSGLIISWPVINAQTGYTDAVALVQKDGGFAVSYDGDPWRMIIEPDRLVLVGPKRLDQPPGLLAQDRAPATGPCYLLLEHYELREDRLIMTGLADLSLSALGTPEAVFANTRDSLTPARMDGDDIPFADELRVYRESPVCRELGLAPSG